MNRAPGDNTVLDTSSDEFNFLDLSDEEVMKMGSPPAPKPAAEATPPAASENAGEQGADDANANAVAAAAGDDGAADGAEAEGEDEGGESGEGDGDPAVAAALNAPDNEIPDPKAAKPAEPAKPVEPAKVEDPKPGEPKPGEAKPATTTEVAPAVLTSEQKVAAYDELFKGFKLNGKDFVPRDIAELKQLAQMGGNYTKKMQELQPAKRIITMLSNNGLMDEEKLNFLIDLDKGNPEAIQKLLTERKIDPLTLDKDKADTYVPTNHQVSDAQMALQSAIEDVFETPTGKELIADIQAKWDPASKDALYKDPATIRVINEHKANGLYAQITAEIERLTTLGQIPAGTPVLQAYYAVGEMLNDRWKREQEEAAKHQAPAQPAQPAQPAAPATPAPERRVVAPAAQVTNNDRARAAAPTKASGTTGKQEINYLEIPDDEFLKKVGHRL